MTNPTPTARAFDDDRDEGACWDRGPRVGEDGTRCVLPEGHEGLHQAHESFGSTPVRW